MIHPTRIHLRNDQAERPGGRYVLYWMQQAQRAQCNHALEYALQEAMWLEKPVVVLFGLTDDFPEANERHYAFLLEGLAETQRTLAQRGIRLLVRHQPPEDAVLDLARQACLVVTDRGFLRIQRQWRQRLALALPVRMVEVETDTVVPVEVASDKEEFAARTLRPKIHRHLASYLVPLTPQPVTVPSVRMLPRDPHELDLGNVDTALARLRIDRSIGRVTGFRGGFSQANQRLNHFLDRRASTYAQGRSEPYRDEVSHMSPYLHFGQISPLEIALRLREHAAVPAESAEVFLEELIVRRELAINFVWFNPAYDTYDCLPNWARQTLADHARDPRPVRLTAEQLEAARSHDPYWNAAQQEMVATGKMHNTMRMYWGKKILEWSRTPQEAFATALRLNNAYQLDGRDPNSFAGVAWCFGKHDRPWTRRPIFGTVRYMNDKGLERKYDIQAYVRKIQAM